MKHGYYKLGFLAIALAMLLTAVAAPVAAQHAVTERDVVHEGHCHLVSDCEATSFVGHAGPALQNELKLFQPDQPSRPVALEETLSDSFSDPVPTPPPIA